MSSGKYKCRYKHESTATLLSLLDLTSVGATFSLLETHQLWSGCQHWSTDVGWWRDKQLGAEFMELETEQWPQAQNGERIATW